MTEKTEALRLADELDDEIRRTVQLDMMHHKAAAELRRLHHNNQVLTDALWKACADDKEVVNSTIASQGELK